MEIMRNISKVFCYEYKLCSDSSSRVQTFFYSTKNWFLLLTISPGEELCV